ncbi:MAG: DNA polymerase IV [Alphaproteobacteria bacterium]|nr:DNA polymerase IV [Alphaproteobacteria bacterium]
MTWLCRDCGADGRLDDPGRDRRPPRCPACGSPRLIAHAELDALSIAHIDCDAFYATVEKRDRPELSDRPVVVGGGRRGVVSAACYVARMYGVRSAMPMFKALEACPEAVVIPPDMAKYAAVGRQVRALMRAVTPLVEPLSIDEAFLDLSGTEAVHHAYPARTLAALARRIERDLGVTVSIGLSYNKFLAKIASDLDKPRGFAVIGQRDALDFLGPRPVGTIWGVGKALEARLNADGIGTIAQLRERDERELVARYGTIGRRLHRFARGEDDRKVEPDRPTKSISAENTFDRDRADLAFLRAELWPLCETVSRRLKKSGLAARSVTLKLKTAQFRLITRSTHLAAPTQLAETLFRSAEQLLQPELDGTRFRLIGVGGADLSDATEADPPDLFDPEANKRRKIEQTIDQLRGKLGDKVIAKGRGLRRP